MRARATVLLSLILSASAFAHPTNVGYSGAPGTMGTCASSCHGVSGGTVQVFGFPTAYTPGQQYTITIRKISGATIKNFNSSIRVGSGSQTAGTIAAGLLTGIYNTSGESNGVHMTSIDHDSATFHWTAPAAGRGTVRLYLGAHQGDRNTGPNSARVLVSTEAPALPGASTNPHPGYGESRIAVFDSLTWTAGSGATSHDIYFGTDSAALIAEGNQTSTSFLPDSRMIPGTTYYWRIDERNAAGITPGLLWQFTTLPLPGMPESPAPENQAVNVPVTTDLVWTTNMDVVTCDLRFGLENPPPTVATGLIANTYHPASNLLGDTVYYWQCVCRNSSGDTEGPIWQFRTETPNGVGDPGIALPTSLVLGPVYPNPFNAVVTVPFVLPQAAEVHLILYDINGRMVAQLVNGTLNAGDHQVQWSSEGFGSGIYLLRLTTASKTLTTKIVALK